MKDESFNYILSLSLSRLERNTANRTMLFRIKEKIQIKQFLALDSVIFGADALISGKRRVIVLKSILYLQPKMRYCGEQIVMKQMKSSSLLRECYRTS